MSRLHLSISALILAATAQAQFTTTAEYIDSVSGTAFAGKGAGQLFKPADAGLVGNAPLARFTFWHGSATSAYPSTEIYLSVYEEASSGKTTEGQAAGARTYKGSSTNYWKRASHSGSWGIDVPMPYYFSGVSLNSSKVHSFVFTATPADPLTSANPADVFTGTGIMTCNPANVNYDNTVDYCCGLISASNTQSWTTTIHGGSGGVNDAWFRAEFSESLGYEDSVPVAIDTAATPANKIVTIIEAVSVHGELGVNTTNDFRGQTFTTSINGYPVQAAVTPKVFLKALTLRQGNNGVLAGSATTYLNIHADNAGAIGAFVASSTNAFDTGASLSGDRFRFEFDQIALNNATTYWAILSSTNTSGTHDVQISLRSRNDGGDPVAVPPVLPVGTYSGGDAVDGAFTLSSEFDAEMLIEYNDYGVAHQGYACTVPPPFTQPLSPPLAGGTYKIAGTSPNPAYPLTLMGFGVTTSPPIPLAFVLPASPLGCDLQINALLVFGPNPPGVPFNVTLTHPTHVPGFEFYAQGFFIDPAITGIIASDVSKMTLGN